MTEEQVKQLAQAGLRGAYQFKLDHQTAQAYLRKVYGKEADALYKECYQSSLTVTMPCESPEGFNDWRQLLVCYQKASDVNWLFGS